MKEAIETTFPGTDHQLCLIHLQRNIRKSMSKEDARNLNRVISQIKTQDFDEAKSTLEATLKEYQKKYPAFIKRLLGRVDNYIVFLKYPEPLRKHIYTTCAVESINSIVEKIRIRQGGYFQSVQSLELNFYIQIDKLKRNKWAKPITSFRSALYEMNQIFNLRFYNETQNS